WRLESGWTAARSCAPLPAWPMRPAARK
ncbi:MAG: hypothetical protein AVDCRST_MAG26-2392, partial [uncultured Chloroflexia bacterium]